MWIAIKDASSLLSIKEKTIYSLVNQGVIPHYRIGKMIRFSKDELETWMVSKKVSSEKIQVAKIVRSAYTPYHGRPGHLKKEVG